MSCNYHTTRGQSQSGVSLPLTRRGAYSQAVRSPLPHRRRPAVPAVAAHPLLAGDREELRRLRAAEMAAWAAAFPNLNQVEECTLGSEAPALRQTAASRRRKMAVLTVLVLATCGSVAVSLDLQDFSLLHTAWSQLVAGLRSVFA